MGRYYPPDASNPPRFNTNSHPLGSRASKISSGILTVRFELPFSVWCNHCTPSTIIGQGVRFNAEKKKVGAYYSTPIWSFRMKHSACGGDWEIRTDPKNTAYVCHEGCRRREDGSEVADAGLGGGFGEDGEGDMRFLSEEERKKRRDDAFAGFEGKMEEKTREDGLKERLDELYAGAETWRNPYDVNARLRRDFRANRKVWKKEEREIEAVRDKYSLGMDIVGETETDRAKARLIQFGDADRAPEDAIKRPLFDEGATQHTPETTNTAALSKGNAASQRHPKKLKAEIKAEQSRASLQQKLIGNSRAAIDPFLNNSSNSQSPSPFHAPDTKATTKLNLGILKRKRDGDPVLSTVANSNDANPNKTTENHTESSSSSSNKQCIPITTSSTTTLKTQNPVPLAALVDYDSD
ncbi:DUF572-domain-containing protein [Periconia macrospinosa]|uniref:DUF572-domain-containing protein n=1 Tax=Periconia macrospinosa TaxID=97972 RepID=A0A2V1DRV0_9PLEO|nr:DUF572-domain-containing protein [Periconia macrospinosa]